MKTAMQELFSKLEIEQPQLFNIHTTEGKNFVNSYIKFIELEKKCIENAFNNGVFTDQFNLDRNFDGEKYYNTEFKNK